MLFLGGMSLQEMTGAEEASGSLATGHGSCTEREDSCSVYWAQMDGMSGAGEDKEDL